MKKFISIILLITMLFSMAIVVSADTPEYIDSQYTVCVDGAFVDISNLTIDGIEVSKPTVAAEIDSDEILVSGSIDEYKTYKGYADKINTAIKRKDIL